MTQHFRQLGKNLKAWQNKPGLFYLMYNRSKPRDAVPRRWDGAALTKGDLRLPSTMGMRGPAWTKFDKATLIYLHEAGLLPIKELIPRYAMSIEEFSYYRNMLIAYGIHGLGIRPSWSTKFAPAQIE